MSDDLEDVEYGRWRGDSVDLSSRRARHWRRWMSRPMVVALDAAAVVMVLLLLALCFRPLSWRPEVAPPSASGEEGRAARGEGD